MNFLGEDSLNVVQLIAIIVKKFVTMHYQNTSYGIDILTSILNPMLVIIINNIKESVA